MSAPTYNAQRSWHWGPRSSEVRSELHIDLVLCVDQALEWSPFDLALTEGFRGAREQTEAYEAGLSELRFPASRHNLKPSCAVHIEPYPIDYNDLARYHLLGGLMIAAGKLLQVGLRWLGPTSLRDYAHWELPK